MKSRCRPLGFALFGLICAVALHADVTPHALFCDHAVLQRDKPIPVWGQAAPGEKVAVRLGDLPAQSTTADAAGRWSVRLPAQPAGGPFKLVFEGIRVNPTPAGPRPTAPIAPIKPQVAPKRGAQYCGLIWPPTHTILHSVI